MNDLIVRAGNWLADASIATAIRKYHQLFPQTLMVLRQLFQNERPSMFTPANLALCAATVIVLLSVLYLGTVVLNSYRSLVRSLGELWTEEEFIDKKLKVLVDQEINPVMEAIEENDKRELRLCGRNKMMRILKEKIDKIQNILNDVKNLKSRAIEGEAKSKQFQVESEVTVAVIGCSAAAIAALVVGLSWLSQSFFLAVFGGAGALGYYTFGKSKENYRESLRNTDMMNDKARKTEEDLTALRAKAEVGYINILGIDSH